MPSRYFFLSLFTIHLILSFRSKAKEREFRMTSNMSNPCQGSLIAAASGHTSRRHPTEETYDMNPFRSRHLHNPFSSQYMPSRFGLHVPPDPDRVQHVTPGYMIF